MSDVNINITEYLNQYLAIDNPGFAVLLKGPWGCGKTWFINDYIAKYTETDKKFSNKVQSRFLKLSLNGLDSPEAIDRRLFFALHPHFQGEYTELFVHLASGILALAKADSLIKSFKFKDFTHAIKGKVLVFDDLERCCMPIAETLGYLNDFIERINLHVIVLAFEKEIDKIEQAGGNERITKYDIMKEKVIGRRLEVAHNTQSVLNSFTGKLSSNTLRHKLKDRTPLIIDIFDKSESRNLRILLHALIDFERLWEKLSDTQKESSLVLEKLLTAFLCFRFDIDKARITPKDLSSIETFQLNRAISKADDADPEPVAIANTFDRYPMLNSYYIGLSPSAWVSFFDKGFIAQSTVRECIDESGLLPENQSPLVTLWHWSDMEDDELITLAEESIQELNAERLSSPFVILHIAGILIRLCNHQLIKYTLIEIIKIFKDAIDNLAKSGKLEYAHPSDLRSGHACLGSLRFQSDKTKEFIEIREHIVQKMLEIDNNISKEKAEVLPRLMLTDMVAFVDAITHNTKDTFYYRKPILCDVDPNEFMQSILKLPNKLKWDPFHALAVRYEFIVNAPDLAKELSFLNEIDKITTEIIEKNKRKNSTIQLEGARKEHLLKAISIITNFSLPSHRISEKLTNRLAT